MSKIWVVSPYGNPSELYSPETYLNSEGRSFYSVWEYDKMNNAIGLGSNSLRKQDGSFVNPEGKSLQHLVRAIRENHPEYSERKSMMRAKVLRKIYNDVKEGDIIVAKQGLRKVLAIGRVFSKDGKVAYFSVEQGFERTRNKNNPHANFINVKWKIKNLTFEDRIFRIGRFGEIYNMVVKRHQKKYLPMIFKEIEALWKERYELLS